MLPPLNMCFVLIITPQTHDEIKLYKQELTGSPFTPLLAYNGKVLKDVGELKKIFGCIDD